jgi:hypothetical protein
MGGTAAIIATVAGAKSASDSRQDAKQATARMDEDQRKLLADRETAKMDAEKAKKNKLLEELGRKGRRASILTSSSGIADQLGSVARPQAQALTETLG